MNHTHIKISISFIKLSNDPYKPLPNESIHVTM